MADRLLLAAQRLADQQEANAGRALTYSRKVNSVVKSGPVIGTVGHTLFKQTDTAGRLRMEHGDRDYLIRSATLTALFVAWDAEKQTPQSGDQITDATDGVTYTVAGPGLEPVWRKSDPFGVRLRIHCKETG